MEIRIGCSGWSYGAWVGPFYPKGSGSSDFLRLYSKVFDTVEIDSSFYGIPNRNTVMKWGESTPENFLFAPKFPGDITHKHGLNVDPLMVYDFIDPLKALGKKLGPMLVQLPAKITYQNSMDTLRKFLEILPEDTRFAIEFRNESWFRKEVYKLLESYSISMAWSDIPMTKVPTIMTADFIYLRLVGDRTIASNDFGTVRIDRNESIIKWAEEINNKKNGTKNAFVFSNNHYQGFSPETVNIFRKAMNMETIDWLSVIRSYAPENQRKLF